MPNRFKDRVPVAAYNPKGKVVDDLASVSRSDGSAFTQIANAAESVATKFGGIADTLATREGKKAGAPAGLDPNFKPTGLPTLRGEAYDKAATETYANTLDTHLRTDLQKAIDDNSDSPSKLRAALDQVRGQYLADHVFDEVRPAFEKTFDKLSLPALHSAQASYDKTVTEGARQSFEANASMQKTTLTSAASAVGIDRRADDAVVAQLDDYSRTLDRGVADGHIEMPVAIGMKRDAAAGAATAAITGMFNRLPDRDAQEAFLDNYGSSVMDVAKRYAGLDPDVLDQVHAQLVGRLKSATDAAANIENNADALRAAQAEAQGMQLLKAGQLTPDWADAHIDRLGVRVDDWRNAATSAPATSRPTAYADLLRQAIDDPAAAPGAAVTAVAEGDLTRADFAAVHDFAGRIAQDQAERPWLNDIRRDVATRSAPGDDQGDEQSAIQAQALPAFESWLAANPQAGRAEIARQGDEIVGQFVASAAASARATLPLPRFAGTARNEITPAALPSIAQRLSLAHDAGEIDDDELIAQSELLDRWKAAVERHSGRSK